ncbi:MAG: HAMP domain-containing histidine kinase, partial [Muribaculaceae bacterium]|nr:HAMP domain-containing histidine kinase [Muribaculaceae bacterium]
MSNKISYSGRLFLWLLLYSLLLVSGIIIFQYHREKEFRAELLNAQLQLVNAQIITELSKGTSPDDIRPDGVPLSDELRVSVISPAGEVVYDNALDSIGGSNHLDRAEIRSALSHGSGYAERRHSKTTGTNYFYSATRGSNGYIVRTAVPYTISLDSLLEADYGFIWVIGVLTAVMCALGYIASRKVGLHIQRLRKFAQNVENGERISDTEPFPHDELGEISNHIVRLYAMLQQANADRDREHRSAMREHQEKERIKKQLTNNINHELKTPVASIQICLETLLAHRTMSEEKKEMFLRRSLMNTERLKRLLNDVSAITRMDDGGRTILKEAQNLTEIIRTAVDEYGTLAAAKGIALECNIPDKITVTGN